MNDRQRDLLGRWLAENQLVPFTANAFPQRDFHQPEVKRDVYSPDWSSDDRREYTMGVFQMLHEIAPAELELSVSTLPLGWPTNRSKPLGHSFFVAAATNLLQVVSWLEELELSTGRLAYLCIEPEPGCLIDTSDGLVAFFERWLFVDSSRQNAVRRYLRVCHDVCHSAVMFEPQVAAVERYRQAGISVGKVQISSAVEAKFNPDAARETSQKIETLRSFDERRYLHQTSVRRNGQTCFYQDLRDALDTESNSGAAIWRVHFHVPVFAAELGPLTTTQPEIGQFFRALDPRDRPKHFEVETYAWNVLPPQHAPADLAAGIAAEMDWVEQSVYRID